jgi:glutathione peroxidase
MGQIADIPLRRLDAALRDQWRGHGVETGEPPAVLWNFEKVIVDRDGVVTARFAPDVTADDPRLLSRLDEVLGASPQALQGE